MEGAIEDYVTIMAQKHDQHGVKVDEEDMIMISSYDGANIIQSSKTKYSVISYSSSVFNASTINEKTITAGQTYNILTWQQVLGKLILSRDINVCQMNHNIFEDTSTKKKINCYDCHDGKMIYLLPQCSLWKNKHHPFIICKCRRNIGVQQNDHKYEMFTDEEYERLWNRSKRCYQSKLTTEDAHRN